MHRRETGLVHEGRRMFRHILWIKDTSIFVNHLQWYWLRHYIFNWFISLIIIKVFCLLFIVTGFLLHRLHVFCMPFFYQTQKDNWDREWMSKQCQKLRSKVKESFVKLVSFYQSRYIYIYTLYHVAFGHFIPPTVLFSL